MSAKNNRKNMSPGKQGPLRATVPLSLMQASCSPTRCPPSESPPIDASKVKSRLSPDNRISPESATSPGYRGGGERGNGGSARAMRRTASVDTIFLLGAWQRDALYLSYCGRLMVDRATQTPDEFEEPPLKMPQKKCSAASGETLEVKYLRQRLQQRGGGRASRPSPPASPVQAPPSTSPRPIPAKPPSLTPRMRSSVEGLNQEIERIVLREISNADDESGGTPEGHRAPIADLLRGPALLRASVDTQTPCDDARSSASSSSVSPRPSSSEGSKSSSSPDLEGTHKLATSPHINKFLAREPPDGCEKIKIAEESRSSAGCSGEAPELMKPSVNFVLVASQRSAFDTLCKGCNTPNGDLPSPPQPL